MRSFRLLTLIVLGLVATAAAAQWNDELAARITALRGSDPKVAARAAYWIARHPAGAESAIPDLQRWLADDTAIPRYDIYEEMEGSCGDFCAPVTPSEEAAHALAKIGGRAFDVLLDSVAKHASPVARRNSAWALGTTRNSRAVPALIGALADQQAEVRTQAAWALGALRDDRAVEPLMKSVRDSDPQVRSQAAWALGALRNNRAVTALAEAVVG